MENLIIDTNIVDYYLDNDSLIMAKFQQEVILNKLFISAISYYEIKRGLFELKRKFGKSPKLEAFNLMLETIFERRILMLEKLETFDCAINICGYFTKIGRSYRDNDILIAATTITNDMTLVTNDGDFGNVVGLKTTNWK